MRSKLFVVLFVVMMLVAACGGQPAAAPQPTAAPVAQEQPTMAPEPTKAPGTDRRRLSPRRLPNRPRPLSRRLRRLRLV